MFWGEPRELFAEEARHLADIQRVKSPDELLAEKHKKLEQLQQVAKKDIHPFRERPELPQDIFSQTRSSWISTTKSAACSGTVFFPGAPALFNLDQFYIRDRTFAMTPVPKDTRSFFWTPSDGTLNWECGFAHGGRNRVHQDSLSASVGDVLTEVRRDGNQLSFTELAVCSPGTAPRFSTAPQDATRKGLPESCVMKGPYSLAVNEMKSKPLQSLENFLK